MIRNSLIFIALVALVFNACSPGGPQPAQQNATGGKSESDLPTRGSIKIMVDEGYRPIVETTLDVFDSIYRQTDIEAAYTSEGEAVKALIDDSIDVIIITRKLTQEENQYFIDKNGQAPKFTAIAHDALAFILHPSNKDTVLTVQQVRDILTGKITDWKQINPKSKLGPIRLVFDNAQSGTVRFAKDSILQGQTIFSGAAAMKTNMDVINYVGKQKNALGIIGANWVSDTDDQGVQKFLTEVQLADIAKETGAEGFGPYQGYLKTGDYPFKRTVFLVNNQNRSGLGLGLASFMASHPGQLIVLKAGLLPATAPIRVVKPQ